MHQRILAAAVAAALALTACGGGSDDVAPPAPATPTELAVPTLAFSAPGESIDLSNFTLVGKYPLPVGSGNNLLASEVSAVTYNWDTDTLFLLGDHGTAIVQVTKTGQLIDTMTLPADAAQPQGTAIYDPEGLAYIGGGRFVLAEERVRQAVRFTYTPNTTLDIATAQRVKLGTTIGNVGLEGVTFDPVSGGYIFVKEKTPLGIFLTQIDFAAGTASNGSATTVDSTNLFDPALAGAVADFGDVYALANVLPAAAADRGDLLVLSQESGRILKMTRSGQVRGTADIELAAQHEGITLDRDLNLYVTNELGTGGVAGEELWVYAPTRNATAVGRGSHLYLNFGSDVVAGTGSIQIASSTGDVRTVAVTDASQVSFKGATVAINLTADLQAGKTYSVTYAAGVIRSSAGVPAKAVSDTAALRFTTVGDVTVPQFVSASPADNALGVTGSHVVLTFDEPVKAGAGTITLSNGSDDVRVISASDVTQVTISGNTVDINPSADLRPATAYHVKVSATAITDVAGNPYAGFTDPARLNFSTASSAVPTTLQAGDVMFLAVNADSPDAFSFMLMRSVTTNTQIFFSDRDTLTATNESAFVWTADTAYPAGTIVTIQPDVASGTAPIADRGVAMGKGGGISQSAETLFAFQGSVAGLSNTTAGNLTVDRYLAAINVGGALTGTIDNDLRAALDGAGAYISLPSDNVRYAGSLSIADVPALRALLANPSNWAGSDTVPFALTGNSLYP